jgi:hypothetical protein
MRIAHPRLTSVNLREQSYPMLIAFAFEKNTRRRSFFSVAQLHGCPEQGCQVGSHLSWPADLINAPRFFPWRQTFGQRAAPSVDRPNAVRSAYQHQLHRWDRGPRKSASASVLVSSLRQCATSLPIWMFNFEQLWSWQLLLGIAVDSAAARSFA